MDILRILMFVLCDGVGSEECGPNLFCRWWWQLVRVWSKQVIKFLKERAELKDITLKREQIISVSYLWEICYDLMLAKNDDIISEWCFFCSFACKEEVAINVYCEYSMIFVQLHDRTIYHFHSHLYNWPCMWFNMMLSYFHTRKNINCLPHSSR